MQLSGEQISIALAVIAIVSNCVTIYLSLYVKLSIAPLVERSAMHGDAIEDLKAALTRLESEISRQGRVVAWLRGRIANVEAEEHKQGNGDGNGV